MHCMKSQNLFSGKKKNKKNINSLSTAELAPERGVGLHKEMIFKRFKGNGFTFRGDKSVKIVLPPSE